MSSFCEWARVDEFKGCAHWGLAFAALLRGQHVEALSHARTSLSIYSAQDTPIGDAMDFDLVGWIHISTGRPELGAVLIGVASGLWHTVGQQLFGSPEWIKQREQAEAAARSSLGDEPFELALERGHLMPLDEAIALALDKAVKRPATSTHPQSTLTPREAQVASLLAEGLSNKEISQRLVISVRTAETHVERILTKLGLTSRSQVAQWGRDSTV